MLYDLYTILSLFLDEINPIDTFSNWLEWQRNLQYTNTIGHSKDSEILCNLLMLAERKKLNSSLYEGWFTTTINNHEYLQ